MTDIVDRLRSFGPDWTAKQTGSVVPYEVCVAAADEIDRLRAALAPERLAEIIGGLWMGSPKEQDVLDETVRRIRAGIAE